jgi:hypothetical protein
MADDAQVIDDALTVLKEIRREYRNEPVADLAALMLQQIRPTMAFDSALEERERIYERTPKEFTEAAAKVLAKRGPAYKTPVFKCLEDFEKCKNTSSSKTLCRAALAICIAKHLLPFVQHEKSES